MKVDREQVTAAITTAQSAARSEEIAATAETLRWARCAGPVFALFGLRRQNGAFVSHACGGGDFGRWRFSGRVIGGAQVERCVSRVSGRRWRVRA